MPRYTGARPVYSGRVDHTIQVNARKSETPIQVQEAFVSAMEGMAPPLPGTLAGLRDALGGTNKAAALIVLPGKDGKPHQGVAPRTLQRYIAAEENRAVSGHSKRRADVAKRGDIVRQLQDILAPRLSGAREAAMERDGVAMTALGSVQLYDGLTEGRYIHWRIEGRYWAGKNGILAAWRADKKQLAARRFNRAFGDSYGKPGGIPNARWSYLNELTFELPK